MKYRTLHKILLILVLLLTLVSCDSKKEIVYCYKQDVTNFIEDNPILQIHIFSTNNTLIFEGINTIESIEIRKIPNYTTNINSQEFIGTMYSLTGNIINTGVITKVTANSKNTEYSIQIGMIKTIDKPIQKNGITTSILEYGNDYVLLINNDTIHSLLIKEITKKIIKPSHTIKFTPQTSKLIEPFSYSNNEIFNLTITQDYFYIKDYITIDIETNLTKYQIIAVYDKYKPII